MILNYEKGLYVVKLMNKEALKGRYRDTLLLLEIEAKNEKYLKNIKGIDDIMRLPDTEKMFVWRFTNIKNVIKLNKNNYKIQAEYIDIIKNKTKKITFKLKNRYNNFNDLVKIFEDYKNEED